MLHRGSSNLDNKKSVIRFTDSLPKAAQMHQYRVEIDPENDQFTENNAATAITAVDLPAVFSQETVAVARAQYVSKETPLTFTDGWSAIAQDTIRLPTFVDGYNRTFLRPEASSALVSLDEDKVPLLASWQKGLWVGWLLFPFR